jgi:hypothetical protein
MDKNNNNNNNNNSNSNSDNNKHQGMVVVVALIAAASLLSLGAVAATTITPAYADGHDDDGGTEKNIDELIILNKDNKPLSQEGLLQILAEQPTKPQPAKTVEDVTSTVGIDGFSAPSLP